MFAIELTYIVLLQLNLKVHVHSDENKLSFDEHFDNIDQQKNKKQA